MVATIPVPIQFSLPEGWRSVPPDEVNAAEAAFVALRLRTPSRWRRAGPRLPPISYRTVLRYPCYSTGYRPRASSRTTSAADPSLAARKPVPAHRCRRSASPAFAAA